MVTESRSYKPLGISSNYRLAFLRLYITGLRVYDVRSVRRVLRLRRRGFTLSSDVAVRSRFSGCCNHHDFGVFLSQWFEDFPRILTKIFRGGLIIYIYTCFWYPLQLVICECSIGGFLVGVNWVSGRALVFIFVAWWGVGVFNFSKLLVRGCAWWNNIISYRCNFEMFIHW